MTRESDKGSELLIEEGKSDETSKTTVSTIGRKGNNEHRQKKKQLSREGRHQTTIKKRRK